MLCELCGCDEAYNFHHLIPRTLHGNKWFKKRFSQEELRQGLEVCKPCHKAIHNLIPDEKELGRHFNTTDKLLAQPDVAKYVQWRKRRNRTTPTD